MSLLYGATTFQHAYMYGNLLSASVLVKLTSWSEEALAKSSASDYLKFLDFLLESKVRQEFG